MNLIQLKSAFVILLALSLLKLTLAYAAPPTRVTVTAASPNSALQGEALNVVISGSGFGHGSTVKYLVSGTNDDSQIAVSSVTYNEVDDTLTTTIQVGESAVISEYDIEVQPLSGRRGKGTTLFSVQANENNAGGQNNLPQISCDELFGFVTGTCTAEGTSDPCMFEENLDDRGVTMLQHCDTRAMLVLTGPDIDFLLGGGYRLNLVTRADGTYSGIAGIANSRGDSRINGFHIVAHPGVGCGTGYAETAVYFDPDLQPTSNVPRGAVANITVEAVSPAKFCNGIEFVGTDPIITHPYKGPNVEGNWIKANSYVQVGIWVAHVNLSDEGTWHKEFLNFSNNVVETTDSPCAIGMLLDKIERLRVQDNLVNGAACGDITAALAVLGSGRNVDSPSGAAYDFLTAESVELFGNTIVTGGGGSIGIVVDSETTLQMSSSQITAGGASDVAVCVETGAEFSEAKKRSTFIGFDPEQELVFMADCGLSPP